ncbi:MAG TPA: hypothetical protein VGI75_14795 [Pirellulales bacterium]|jgi:hypothetical protein
MDFRNHADGPARFPKDIARFMYHPRALVSLLIVACGLLDLCFWFASYDHSTRSIEFAITAIEFCQINLLAVWLAIGRTRFFWRFMIVCACLMLLCHAILPPSSREVVGLFAMLTLLQTLVAAVPLAAMRYLKFQLYRLDDEAPSLSETMNREFQFSILSLFELTAGIAVMAAIAMDLVFQQRDTNIMAAFAMSAGLPTPLIAWAMLCDRKPQWSIILALFVAAAVSALIPLIRSIPGISSDFFGLFFGQALLLALGLYVCRIAGYRFSQNHLSAQDAK